MLQNWLLRSWYQGAAWLLLLRPLEWLYLLLRWLHQTGRHTVADNPLPLVVVGNLNMGGVGKTPLVAALVEHFQRQGWRPAVISRGYRAMAQQFPHLVNTTDTASYTGDEPLMLHRMTGAPVVIDPQRHRACQWLARNTNCNVVISDDGLQHPGLQADIAIVVVDGSRGFGNGRCLPAGPLREPLIRLCSIDLVVVNGIANKRLCWQLRRAGQTSYAIIQPQLQTLFRVVDDQPVPWPDIGKPVRAIAAVGDPQRFFEQLESMGYQIEGHAFGDHHAYSAKDFPWQDQVPLLMTAKDAVKCKALVADARQAWFYCPQSLSLPDQLKQLLGQRLQQAGPMQKESHG